MPEKAQAQDPQFTQFYANPLYLNPALAGSNNCSRFAINYRNQWPSLSGTFVTYSASYDKYVQDLHGGVGLLATSDNQADGTLRTTTVSGIYSYHQPLGRDYTLTFGMQASFWQRVLAKDKLSFGDQIHPQYGFTYQTQESLPGGSASNLDISAGTVLYSKYFFAGVAVHHLTEPDESLLNGPPASPLPIRYTVHAGANIQLPGKHGYHNESSISPNIIYQRQGQHEELNLGLYINRGPIVGGIWYRNGDAVAVLLGVQAKHMKVGYSYDFTTSKLTNVSGGSHEVSLQITLPCKRRRPKFRTIVCPSF